MSVLEKLKKVSSLSDFAHLLGYKPKALSYILYRIPDENKYTEFSIPKKSGGVRIINAPVEPLKKVQTRLANLLTKCFEETCKKHKHKHSLSHGYRQKHSIITNANNHVKKRHVFNVDLEDFFPSIHFGRVKGFFVKNADFELEPKIATIIAQIACHNRELPQGSPCSPVISNLIGHILDIRMANLAKRTKCTYSRYVDDLTFSTNKNEFPKLLAIPKDTGSNEWLPGKALRNDIERARFKINVKKTSLQHRASRQIATGLVVNQKVNIKQEYYKLARAMCHELFTTGEFYFASDPEAKGNMNQLQGILSYIYQIKGPYDISKNGDKLYKPKGITKLYRELLFYKHFFSLEQPLIICEGKTDIVYLKCALRQLASDYGPLVQKKEKGFDFRINFLSLTKTVKDVFAMAEGSSGLLSLIDVYKKHMERFRGQGKRHPVIILVDNDGGSKQIKNKFFKDMDATKQFAYYDLNLYVMFTPLGAGGVESAIEDMFDEKTLSMKVDGKTFNRSAKIDPKKEYGKTVFAAKVVTAYQKVINFEGFEDILNPLVAVIDDYALKQAEIHK